MKINESQSNSNAKWVSAESNDKKFNKLIIPKIKSSGNQSANEQLPSASKKAIASQNKAKKTQKHPNSIGSQYTSNSHIKNFPKQEQLEKMTKKQLAQTYFQQFLRLHRQNEVLDKQLAFVRQERDTLYKRYNELKEEQRNSDDQRPRRQRRVATQIQRNFNCPVSTCDRSYGSEGSLIQHVKIKHQEFYGSNQYYTFLNKQKQQDE